MSELYEFPYQKPEQPETLPESGTKRELLRRLEELED